jgi:hypothetical protein
MTEQYFIIPPWFKLEIYDEYYAEYRGHMSKFAETTPIWSKEVFIDRWVAICQPNGRLNEWDEERGSEPNTEPVQSIFFVAQKLTALGFYLMQGDTRDDSECISNLWGRETVDNVLRIANKIQEHES